MKKITPWLIIPALIIASCSTQNTKTEKTTVEIKNGSYYLNGKKTFIDALGYEIGARPGQNPYEDEQVLDLKRIEYDLERIKKGGFNAIRTWSELTEEQLKVVQNSGLKIVFGIWINPHGEFGDPAFVNKAVEQVKTVMSYTKNYDCIITYLVMNEPMVAHIHHVGAKGTVDLWKQLRDIIHEEHPGIPVTISNSSAIGDFMSQEIFDVIGFNAYNHGRALIYTQGFSEHFQFLRSVNDLNKPLIVTEFGLSISQNGYGMYGGNTLKKQAEHVVENFSDILDGGAAAACAFYYADGWWKANEPAIHNPEPEEWFGYHGYADINDTIGYPRPVWYAITNYIQGIITSPRNHQIYSNKVPVEVFLKDKISEMKVIYMDNIILHKKNIQDYVLDTLNFNDDEIKDREVVFEFYNKEKELVKYETVLFLTSKNPVQIPEIKIQVKENDLALSENCDATFTILNDSPFKLNSEARYLFAHHIGWDSGFHGSESINADTDENTFSINYKVPAECQVLGISAGIEIRFGKFVKRIHAEKRLYRGNWADAIKVD